MTDTLSDKIVEAGVAAAHDDYAIRMGLPVRYADQTERGKKLARDTWEPRVRACLSAALTVAEAEGVILTRVPGSDDGAYSQNPGRREFARIWEKCRAAVLAGKVTL
jgi:hypothetical protein